MNENLHDGFLKGYATTIKSIYGVRIEYEDYHSNTLWFETLIEQQDYLVRMWQQGHRGATAVYDSITIKYYLCDDVRDKDSKWRGSATY